VWVARRSLDAIGNLHRDVDQQEHDYNTALQRMDELDTRLNMQQLQRTKMEQRKSKAAEQGHYQQAGKWQQELKQLDAALDHDRRSHSEAQIQVHSFDTTLTASRKTLQELRSDHADMERKSGKSLRMGEGTLLMPFFLSISFDTVETIITILKDTSTTLSLYPGTSGIIDHELELITNLLSHYDRCTSVS
jgi:flagellar biosynthesis chaperone FliJ